MGRKALIFFIGMILSVQAVFAAPKNSGGKQSKVIYAKKTELDFEGLKIEGEMNSPGEFYFQHRPEEKFDSLVKRRKNFHREMLRDAVLTR